MFSRMTRFREVLAEASLVRFYMMIFFWALAEGILIFYIPLFVEAKIDNLALVGILLAINPLAAAITDTVFGFVTEVSDHRKFFYLGIVMCLALLPMFLWGTTVWPISVMLILWGAEFEMFVNFGTPLFLVKHTPKESFSKAASFNYTIRNLGYLLGPLVADYLFLQLGQEVWLVALLAILYIIVVCYIYINFHMFGSKHYSAKAGKLSLYSELSIIKKHFRKVIPFVIIGFGAAAFEAIFFVFGSIELAKMTSIAGVIMSLIMLANVVIPPILVPIIPKSWLKGFLVVSCLLIGVGTFSMSYIANEWILAMLLFVLFSLLASSYVAVDSLFLKALSRIKNSEEDEITSVNSLGPNVAYIFVAFFGGSLLQTSSFASGAAIGAGILIICTLIFLKLFHDPK